MTFAPTENGKKVLTMDEYIRRETAIAWFMPYAHVGESIDADVVISDIKGMKAADVAPVVHGRWELTVHSFYRDTFDESCELCVYIVANCSECSGNHPNSYQVSSKTIYAPEDAGDDFRFDQKEEENKALQEFQRRNYQFAYYCPNCGAKMDVGDSDEAD